MANGNPDAITDEVIQKVQKGSMEMPESKAIALAGELFTRGKYGQAANVCRQIIKNNPSQADACNILGVSLNALGKSQEAVNQIGKAIKLAPRVASFHANLGEVQRKMGALDQALTSLNEAVKLDPNNPQAHNNLGIVRYEREEYEEAVACYKRALEQNPIFPEAYNNLGNSLRLTQDQDGALQAYQNALSNREVYPEAYNNLGTLLRELKKPEQAEHALRKAIAQNPRYIDAYSNLASILHAEKDDVEALRLMAEVLKFAPKDPKCLVLTARIQLKRGNAKAAEQACRLVIVDDPDNAKANTVLGQVMHETDRYEEAIYFLTEAVELDPKQGEAHNFLGIALKSVGRLDEAREQILKAIDLNERMYGAYANLNDLIDYSHEKELFAKLEALMEASEDPQADNMIPLHFAYAKALEDTGNKEKALEHYILGGQLKRKLLRYIEAETFEFFDDIKQAFPAEIFQDRPFKGNDTDQPVFIVGMPRSGSTLVEQIISNHPDVHGAGEVKFLSGSLHLLRDRFPSLSRYPKLVGELNDRQFEILTDKYLSDITANSEGKSKVTDKLLTNYFFVGIINLMYPNAKIINTQRNSIDTCLSAFTKLFKDDMPHSYDLQELGRYYCKYEELMNHWQNVLPQNVMKTVVYEDVVQDTEAAARGLIEFIGLPWDKACLDFHMSSRPVKTASVAQVRKPIYKTAVARWMKYGEGLTPLVDALGSASTVKANAPD